MMSTAETIRQAFRSLRANLMRTSLTLLIIAFGIMALVGILTAIDSIIYSLSDNFSSLGANAFTIAPRGAELGGQRQGRRIRQGDEISYEQALKFKQRYDFPARVSLSMAGPSNAEARFGDKKTNPNVSVIGVDESYIHVKGYDLKLGRNFVANEIESQYQRAIIGMDLVDLLFDGQPEKALDQPLFLSNLRYRIIGILDSRGSSINQAGDRVVLVPVTLVRQSYGNARRNVDLVVGVYQSLELDEAIDAAIGLFRSIRGLRLQEEQDFQIFKSDGLVSLIKDNTLQLRLAAIGIGIITLLGAAIGLMNIMLVSVAERTREIGVVKALGARKRDILYQFLAEAVIICNLGGLLGIVLGILAGNGVSFLVGSPFIIPWAWMGLGILVCTLVGLLAGILPAAKASRLDPIESLRYE